MALGLPKDIAGILASEDIDYPLLAEWTAAVRLDVMFRELFIFTVAHFFASPDLSIQQEHHLTLSLSAWHMRCVLRHGVTLTLCRR